jgi:probable F420-dependent oxidoreductase
MTGVERAVAVIIRGGSMEIGILMFVTERSLAVTELAQECEAHGIESLWVPEHPVVPAEYKTRYPLSADGKLPRPYTELPDQFAVLAAAAVVTTRLRVGTGICLVPQRDPVLLAHQVATLDWLSGGRFLFGIGAGWLKEEMELFTPHFPHRFAFMREAVAAMRALWAEERDGFSGKWIRFPRTVCRPRPVQQPHPPVILGGMGPNALKRVAAWGDGWMPIAFSPDAVREARQELNRLAADTGRDARRISFSVMIGAPPGLEQPMLDMMPSRDVLQAYEDAGASRIVVCVPTLKRDDALRHLERIGAAA